MGQSASKARSASKGIIVTLDALGTLYKFKEPIAKQYLKVARQCEVTGIQEDDLMKAFKSSYKSHTTKYPNYGKGKLDTPLIWWKGLVHDTFSQVTDHVPEELGTKLYHHFTSAEAYELFPDVKPFFKSLQSIRKDVIVGVITNSDPRVRNVFENFQLDVGDVGLSAMQANAMSGKFPWNFAWNPQRDLDFVVTSYDAGAEKPSETIFAAANSQAVTVQMGKKFGREEGILNGLGVVWQTRNVYWEVQEMQWIHVGDEMVKDVEAAENYGIKGLLLDREGEYEGENRISSLDELATVVRLLAQDSSK